jgi:hypothetical protein
MAEISAELVYEILKSIQSRLTNIEGKIGDVDARLSAMSLHSLGIQTDVKNIYSIVAQIEASLDRVERRLDIIAEPAE